MFIHTEQGNKSYYDTEYSNLMSSCIPLVYNEKRTRHHLGHKVAAENKISKYSYINQIFLP